MHLIHGELENITSDHLPSPVQLVIADPPDNIGLDYDNYVDRKRSTVYDDLLASWLVKSCNLTTGPVFFTFNPIHTSLIERAITYFGVLLVQRIYWHFTFGQNSQRTYTPSIRPIYWLNNPTIYPDQIKIPSARQTKYKDKRAKAGGRLPDNLWEFPRVCGTHLERRKWHECQLPESLVQRIILGHTREQDCVLDGFVGSGTSAYVALANNRQFIGVDQSQFYLDKIKAECQRRGLV